MTAEDRVLQHAASLALAVDKIAALRKYGSYSERNPALGKMIRCPHCRVRRREFGPPCCNTNYLVETSNVQARASFKKKRKNPRLTRRRPPLFLVHQLLLDVERDLRPDLENVAEKNLPGYIEKLVKEVMFLKRKSKQGLQMESRKINRE